MPPTVSIVLPTHNGSRYLRRAIESCLRQTYRQIELITVDDGSTDGTAGIIRSFDDPRIRSLRHERNQGLPRSLNHGFAQARGAYLTWTSDDNEFLPRAIEAMLACLAGDPAVDFVYADFIARDLETGDTKERRLSDPVRLDKANGVGPCFLYTRRVYETIGEFHPAYELVEDYEYWIRVAKRFRMKRLPQCLYLYGAHAHSLTGSQALSVTLADTVLKYRHKYLPFQKLKDTMVWFLMVAIDDREGLKGLAALWYRTACRLFRLSLGLGLLFLLLACRVFSSRALGSAAKKASWPFRKLLQGCAHGK